MTLSNSKASFTQSGLPPLENGDRLTQVEFERRYHAMPHVKKAELVEGVVYMASPLKFEPHAEPHGNLMGWLWNYKIYTPGVRLGDNPTLRLDLDNQPQPDAVLLIDESCGGQSFIGAEGYVEGAPELTAEVAVSNKQMPQVLTTLQAGLNAEPHQVFLQGLGRG